MATKYLSKLLRCSSRLWRAWRSDGGRGAASVGRQYWIKLTRVWGGFWMRFAGLSRTGRLATRLATWFAPPYYAREYLSQLSARGYVSPAATIYHPGLKLGAHVFIGDRVTIFQDIGGASVELLDNVHVYGDTYIQTGKGGSIRIGANTYIQPRCQFSAYKARIEIGRGVAIAPNCAFYPYDHGLVAGRRIEDQPLETKGDIIIGDDAWIGTGVIVLSGVRIGTGAVVGAGSVVTTDVPADCIAAGVPARVIKKRGDTAAWHEPLRVQLDGHSPTLPEGKRFEGSSSFRYQDKRAR